MSNRLLSDPEKMAKSLFEPPSSTQPSLFEKLFKLFMYAWVLWVIFSLTCIGALVYAAVHFASKYW